MVVKSVSQMEKQSLNWIITPTYRVNILFIRLSLSLITEYMQNEHHVINTTTLMVTKQTLSLIFEYSTYII